MMFLVVQMTYDDDVVLESTAAGDLAAGECVRLLLQRRLPAEEGDVQADAARPSGGAMATRAAPT